MSVAELAPAELELGEAAAFLANPDDPLPGTNEVNDIIFAIGFILAGFAIYSLRIPLVPWLWNGVGLQLQYFIPVVSPVYREGEHWQAPHTRAAILCHICAGVAMLVLAAVQADKRLRRRHPQWHRWSGRAYVVCGLLTVGSLQVLQSSVGAGASSTPSTSLAWFVDLTSIGWLSSTFVGVAAARARRIDLHKSCMRFSIAFACSPIGQRSYSWVFCAPLAMAARVLVCTGGGMFEQYVPWTSILSIRWSGPSDTLLGDGCVLDEVVSGSRDRPLVLSLDGYGEGEQASFSMSARLSLLSMLFVGLHPWLVSAVRPPAPGTDSTKEFIAFGEMTMFDAWRTIGAGTLNILQTQQPVRNKGLIVYFLWCIAALSATVVCVAFGVAAFVLIATPVFTAMTFAVTAAVFGGALVAATAVGLGFGLVSWLAGYSSTQAS